MAKILKKFEFKSARETSHNWPELFDGKIRELQGGEEAKDGTTPEGVDFTCKLGTFAQMTRNQARRHYKNIKVSVDEEANTITLQATDMTAEQKTAEDARRAEAKAKRAAKKAAGEDEGDETDSELEPGEAAE